jgi:hypothetical protein
VRLVEDAAADVQNGLDVSTAELRALVAEHLEQRSVREADRSVVGERDEAARGFVEQRVDRVRVGRHASQRVECHPARADTTGAGAGLRRYSRMTSIVSSGWLMCGQ